VVFRISAGDLNLEKSNHGAAYWQLSRQRMAFACQRSDEGHASLRNIIPEVADETDV
jgi:hypothetical protein